MPQFAVLVPLSLRPLVKRVPRAAPTPQPLPPVKVVGVTERRVRRVKCAWRSGATLTLPVLSTPAQPLRVRVAAWVTTRPFVAVRARVADAQIAAPAVAGAVSALNGSRRTFAVAVERTAPTGGTVKSPMAFAQVLRVKTALASATSAAFVTRTSQLVVQTKPHVAVGGSTR